MDKARFLGYSSWARMPSYNKPVITEVLAQIFLEQGTLGDAQFFELVPLMKEMELIDVEMGKSISDPQGMAQDGSLEIVPRIRCWSENKKKLVQISRDLLVVNLVAPYPGWEAFESLFDSAFSALASFVSKEKIRSLSFIAIDKFEVPEEGFEFSKFLNTSGGMIPEWYSEVKGACDVNLGKGFVESDGFNKKLNVSLRRGQGAMVFRLNTEIHVALKKGAVVKDLLNSLHDEANEVFEAIITDHLREVVMGGQK